MNAVGKLSCWCALVLLFSQSTCLCCLVGYVASLLAEYSSSLSSKWLLAKFDRTANLKSFSQCIAYGDPIGAGLNSLNVINLESLIAPSDSIKPITLQVITGSEVKREVRLIEPSCGLCTFNVLVGDDVIQDLAIAAGAHIYVYRNLKPYFKFRLPLLPLIPEEEEVWEKAKNGELTPREMYEKLQTIRASKPKESLTPRSIRFLQLPAGEACDFFQIYRTLALQKQTVSTCITKMFRYQSSPDAVQCLIVGVEDKCIYIVDPVTFAVLSKMAIPSVPTHLSANGSFDVDYRIIVACRNGHIYQVKRDTTKVADGIDAGSPIVGLVRCEKMIIVGCMDQTVKGFSLKGRSIWTIRQPAPILSLSPVILTSHTFTGYVVSLTNGLVQLYDQQHQCDTILNWTEQKLEQTLPEIISGQDEVKASKDGKESFSVDLIKRDPFGVFTQPDPISACQCGPFDREPGALTLLTQNGCLIILLVKRSATFPPLDVISGRPVAQQTRLEIPKKSRLFLDLAKRENEHAPKIYNRFVYDLSRLRQRIAQTYLDLLRSRVGPVAMPGAKRHVQMSSKIQGLGPTFLLSLNLIELAQNQETSPEICYFAIVIEFDSEIHEIDPSYIPLPVMQPNITYQYFAHIRTLQDSSSNNQIKIHLLCSNDPEPLITAPIELPIVLGEGVPSLPPQTNQICVE